MKKMTLQAMTLTLLAGSLGATTPLVLPTRTAGSARAIAARPHNDLASAQRALNAAKMFLAKSTNDAGGHRVKAQQAVDTALAELKAALGPAGK